MISCTNDLIEDLKKKKKFENSLLALISYDNIICECGFLKGPSSHLKACVQLKAHGPNSAPH